MRCDNELRGDSAVVTYVRRGNYNEEKSFVSLYCCKVQYLEVPGVREGGGSRLNKVAFPARVPSTAPLVSELFFFPQ